jgi:addiction module RelB/DinJ family antitoxin
MTTDATTLFRARVPAARLRKAEEILSRLGMKPGDALNMLLAQIELREALPFEVTTHYPPTLLTADQQGTEWNNALGSY